MRILIIGAGYGGLRVAMSLQKSLSLGEADITLINKHDYHYQTTLLHKIAAGTLSALKARIYIRKIIDPKKIKFIRDEIVQVLPNENIAIGKDGRYEYDILVVALGFSPNTFQIKGVSEYALKLSSLNSALVLRKQIGSKFKHYSKTKNLSDLTFIVCGTGFTGVEFASELAKEVDEFCLIRGIDKSLVRIICLGRSSNVLPMFDEDLSQKALKKLQDAGVEVMNSTEVIECTNEGVVVRENGAEFGINGNTIIWTAGVRGSACLENSPLKSNNAKIEVNKQLRSLEFENIFAVGDSALLHERDIFYAPTAQLAGQMGDFLGKSLVEFIRTGVMSGEFKFKSKGTVCSIRSEERRVGKEC